MRLEEGNIAPSGDGSPSAALTKPKAQQIHLPALERR